MTFEDVIRRNPDVWMMTKNAICKKHLMEILKSVYFLHSRGRSKNFLGTLFTIGPFKIGRTSKYLLDNSRKNIVLIKSVDSLRAP